MTVGWILPGGTDGLLSGIKNSPTLPPPHTHTHRLEHPPPPSCQVVSPHPMRLFDGWVEGGGGRGGGGIGFHGVPDTNSLQRLGPGPGARRGPWFWVLIPTYQRQINTRGPSCDACEVPASIWSLWPLVFFSLSLSFLMKQLNRRRAGNLLIAACQRRSKYPTGTLYSIIGLATQTATLTGNICASFFLRGPFWGLFFSCSPPHLLVLGDFFVLTFCSPLRLFHQHQDSLCPGVASSVKRRRLAKSQILLMSNSINRQTMHKTLSRVKVCECKTVKTTENVNNATPSLPLKSLQLTD